MSQSSSSSARKQGPSAFKYIAKLPSRDQFEDMLPRSGGGGSDAKPLFKGYIGGGAFCTKKGYKGVKIDTMWVRYLFDAFSVDDDELAAIGLSTSISDLHAQVAGGENGAAFSIGGFGFYAKNQLEMQSKILQDTERENSKGGYFLSTAEWKFVDDTLSGLGHFSDCRFLHATRGDNLACLAVQKYAFSCSNLLLNMGLDPLEANEDGGDLMDMMKTTYKDMSAELLLLQAELQRQEDALLVPTEKVALDKKEKDFIAKCNAFVSFCDSFKSNLNRRLVDIERDKISQKEYEIGRQKVPEALLRNIGNESACVEHLKGCDEIKDSIVTKLQHHSKLVASLVTLADFLKLEHAAATGIAADGMTGMDAGKVAEMKLKLMRNGTMSMADLNAMLGVSDEKNGEVEEEEEDDEGIFDSDGDSDDAASKVGSVDRADNKASYTKSYVHIEENSTTVYK